MNERTYRLRYTPLFQKDLMEAASYIALALNNPEAAKQIVDDVEKAIVKRATCAESFEAYSSQHQRPHPYYRIYVGNYVVFYVVLDDTMEVRRLLYGARNLPPML